MPGITITESRPNEVLAALHASAEAEREYLFAAREAQPDDLILVAWLDEQAVGYIATSDEQGEGLLVWEHVVVPDHRGEGIGQRLLVEAARRTQPGTVVVIDGYRAKDGSRRANGRDITFTDGSKLFMGSSGIGAPYELNQKASPAK